MRLFFISVSFLFLISCSEYQKVLKSEDSEFKYTQALNYYNNEEYNKSLQLFEDILTDFSNLNRSEEIYYHYIYSNFHIKDYVSAAYHFDNFNLKFPLSKKNEEMAYMSAYCYYLQSPRFNLDQDKTYKAIDILQEFIYKYPNSSRIEQVNELIFDLNKKLEKKSFEIIKLYYETGKFNSAIYAVDNFLNSFPETSLLERLSLIQIKSHYELAKNSIDQKKQQRIKDAIFACDNFLLTFPSGHYNEEIQLIYQKLKEIENGL